MRFELNTKGHDYVVGDIHGMFRKLQTDLDQLGFNPDTDRLFCTGDLVDRGPDNELALEWIDYPWFFSVRGNHDQMAIDAAEGFYEPSNYVSNGGAWFIGKTREEKIQFKDAFEELPLFIEVQTNNGLVGILHGDGPTDWQHIDKLHPHWLLWGRARHSRKDTTVIKNIDRVYVGHTPVKSKLILGNVHFIDTGAVFGGAFTIERIST